MTIDGEARVRNAIRLDVTPPGALVLLRRPNQPLFIYAGTSSSGKRDGGIGCCA